MTDRLTRYRGCLRTLSCAQVGKGRVSLKCTLGPGYEVINEILES